MWDKLDIGSRMVEIKKKTEIKAIETALEWLLKMLIRVFINGLNRNFVEE